MLCVGLLNADLQAEGLDGVERVESFRLSENERDRFERCLPEINAFVADLNLINVDSFEFLNGFQGQLLERIREGALLLCFTSRPNLHSPKGVQNKYAWLPFFDGEKGVHEDLVDKIHARTNSNAVGGALAEAGGNFYATCSFPDGFGTDPYETVLEGDDGVPVGLAKPLGEGLVLLLPQSEDKGAVLADVLAWWMGPRDAPPAQGAEASETPAEPALENDEEQAPTLDPAAWAEEVGKVSMTTPTPSAESSQEPSAKESAETSAQLEVLPETPSESDPTSNEALETEAEFEVSETDAATYFDGGAEEPIDLAGDGSATDLSALGANEEPPPATSEEEDAPAASPEGEAPADETRLGQIRQELRVLLGSEFDQYEDLPPEELAKLYETQINAASQSVFDDARDELEALLDKSAERPPPVAAESGAPETESPALEEPPGPAEEGAEPGPPPPPAWLATLKADLPNLNDLFGEAERLEQEAAALHQQAEQIREKIAGLSRWDPLLYLPAEELLDPLQQFFTDVLRAQVSEEPSSKALSAFKISGGGYEFLVHVAASAEPIADAAGRELLRRLADADVDTKGLLVVNGALGDKPPKKGTAHVSKKLLTLASKRGLLILPVDALYRAGLASQREEGWQPEPILDALAGQSGLYGQG